jgi:POT family proton-dependent oligopeptide transporter
MPRGWPLAPDGEHSTFLPPMSPPSTTPATPPSGGRTFFGHPLGLSTLFFTEMWERFSYYGMRAFLILYMTAPEDVGGLAFDATKAGMIYGMYTAMVYLLSVPGGWIADRFMGLRRAVFWGGVLIMTGHLSLAVPMTETFYAGLALVAIGTGLLKPNISTLVGRLYAPGDPRRDGGFSIYYMGINLGAFLAPLVCGGLIAESEAFRSMIADVGFDPNDAWHFAFGAAALGMGLGLVQYTLSARRLGEAGLHPVPPKDTAERKRNHAILGGVLGLVFGVPIAVGLLWYTGTIEMTAEDLGEAFTYVIVAIPIVLFTVLFAIPGWTPAERRRLIVVVILFFGAAVFWSCFEQAGSTLTLFARDNTDRTIFGWGFGVTLYQSLNSIFVIMLAPVFAWLWVRLARQGKNPSDITKFGLAMIGVGAGFAIMILPSLSVADGGKVGWWWLVGLYFVHTVGEMCLSPVGLSSMTKLAPVRIGGMVMGIWFLGASVGNFMAGKAAGLTESMNHSEMFTLMTVFPVVVGILLLLLARPVKKMLARSGGAEEGVDGSGGH